MTESISELDKTGHLLGNFHNYYTFHSSESRIDSLEPGLFTRLWDNLSRPNKFYILDVGCNDGTLSIALYNHVCNEINAYCVVSCPNEHVECFLLGVDIDDELIIKANKDDTLYESSAKFLCYNVMSGYEHSSDSELRPDCIREYLIAQGASGFHFISLFSVTMWVHIRHRDEGLCWLYRYAVDTLAHNPAGAAHSFIGSILVEPQPWKCYKNAKRRCVRNNIRDRSMDISGLSIKDPVLHMQEFFLPYRPSHTRSCSPTDAADSAVEVESAADLGKESGWGRSLMLFHIGNNPGAARGDSRSNKRTVPIG